MQEKNTYEIKFSGIVQGVGFRPFVYNLARRLNLTGFVSNGLEGVRIIFAAQADLANRFFDELVQEAPKKAQISEKSIHQIDNQFFDKFEIRESEVSGESNLILTPDYAVCQDCIAELNDPTNRRFGYPFITCTNCGPRYSIIQDLPYDRANTTMVGFEMCEECQAEYHNPNDRRFYSQTNSCQKCGIKITIYDNCQKVVSNNQSEVINLIINALNNGKIIAVKGVGGYLLICDATHQATVEELRTRKHRPNKPFAVMFSSITEIAENVEFSEVEKVALESDIAPIVLLQQKPDSVVCQAVNPKLDKLGVMLPNSPLLWLICRGFGKPIVATSGNISGNPIIYENQKAIQDFSLIADLIVTNNRDIVIPQDDSVIQYTKKYKQKIIIRRSRGFALALPQSQKTEPGSLALGASLKSTFALKTQNQLYVSQFLGDLESYETQQNFEKILAYYLSIFRCSESLKKVYVDTHKGYFSTELGVQLAEKLKLPICKIQHHQAHFMAVLADNKIEIDGTLGIIWDGTGYGTDGNIWGGEFFYKQNQEIKRIHFQYFEAILGDKMPKEPRISALSLAANIDGKEEILKDKFSDNEWTVFQKILVKNDIKTSSMGRIFDAVTSILRLIDKQTYEGEAAVYLEQLAQKYFDKNHYNLEAQYPFKIIDNQIIIEETIQEILREIKAAGNPQLIAAKFHITLIKIIDEVAQSLQLNKLAFSGGVFQNALLVDLVIHFLQPKYELYFHKNLSPNDENIAYGQISY